MIENIKFDQPVFYQLINNAKANNKLSHAFLLIGKDVDDSLEFLVKMILCDQPIACNTCETCIKIDHKTYADIIEYDGLIESIKKQNIEYIQEAFKKTSIEGKAKIYIIKNIEKSSKESVNALLKMVEEPEGNTIAIFTSKNKSRVLPTIISRCQTIELAHNKPETIYNKLLQNNISDAHARVLSKLTTNVNHALSMNDDRFEYMMLQVINTIEDIFLSHDNLLINCHTNLLKNYKEKDDVRLFLNMLSLALKDMFHVKHNTEIVYEKYRDTFIKLDYNEDELIKKIQLIIETINTLESNANVTLLMDSLLYRL